MSVENSLDEPLHRQEAKGSRSGAQPTRTRMALGTPPGWTGLEGERVVGISLIRVGDPRDEVLVGWGGTEPPLVRGRRTPPEEDGWGEETGVESSPSRSGDVRDGQGDPGRPVREEGST